MEVERDEYWEARLASRRNLSAWLMGLLVGGILVAILVGLGGCSSPAMPLDTQPPTTTERTGRSVSFLPDAGSVAWERLPGQTRWYDDRSDRGLAVFAGYDLAETAVVRSREVQRMDVTNGRVRDNSRRYTVTESIQIRVR